MALIRRLRDCFWLLLLSENTPDKCIQQAGKFLKCNRVDFLLLWLRENAWRNSRDVRTSGWRRAWCVGGCEMGETLRREYCDMNNDAPIFGKYIKLIKTGEILKMEKL